MRKIPSNDELMTTREVGEVLGVAVRTVQLWVESGVLPAWRTAGGHRRIARSAVERLTRERADMLAPVVHGATAPPTRALRLLVVEDDADLRQLFSMMVEGWRFPVELSTANDGFQGLVRIGQWMPDMVVTNLNMPGMNGFEMVRSLKMAGAEYANLQVVAVTALSAGDVADRGGLPEGSVVFQKPVDFSAIEDLARNRQMTLR
ncbi:response regulator [Rhodoferax mekongensis]|uniref:response regulator n=1 Tax=Rhodoferax mekongensis TaxID=3068341 RepID=UPI0028BE4981|nr:response regulator [Rhodoferax sp. TBRC 17199]MDT7514667.1 excisionase family DNA-binding protein [Rhodoferax sp. TBRC 17199]